MASWLITSQGWSVQMILCENMFITVSVSNERPDMTTQYLQWVAIVPQHLQYRVLKGLQSYQPSCHRHLCATFLSLSLPLLTVRQWEAIQVLKNHDLLFFHYIDALLLFSSSAVTWNYHEVHEQLLLLPFPTWQIALVQTTGMTEARCVRSCVCMLGWVGGGSWRSKAQRQQQKVEEEERMKLTSKKKVWLWESKRKMPGINGG